MPYDERLNQLVAYFTPAVLAPYRGQPNKYSVRSNNFAGEGRSASGYQQPFAQAQAEPYIRVWFGYRTLTSGALVVVAFAPDLFTDSTGHLDRWLPFRVGEGMRRMSQDRPHKYGRDRIAQASGWGYRYVRVGHDIQVLEEEDLSWSDSNRIVHGSGRSTASEPVESAQ